MNNYLSQSITWEQLLRKCLEQSGPIKGQNTVISVFETEGSIILSDVLLAAYTIQIMGRVVAIIFK